MGGYAQDLDKEEILYKVYQLAEPVNIASDSWLVRRFYLEETVSQDCNVRVLCAPDGLVKDEVLEPVWKKQMV